MSYRFKHDFAQDLQNLVCSHLQTGTPPWKCACYELTQRETRTAANQISCTIGAHFPPIRYYMYLVDTVILYTPCTMTAMFLALLLSRNIPFSAAERTLRVTYRFSFPLFHLYISWLERLGNLPFESWVMATLKDTKEWYKIQ